MLIMCVDWLCVMVIISCCLCEVFVQSRGVTYQHFSAYFEHVMAVFPCLHWARYGCVSVPTLSTLWLCFSAYFEHVIVVFQCVLWARYGCVSVPTLSTFRMTCVNWGRGWLSLVSSQPSHGIAAVVLFYCSLLCKHVNSTVIIGVEEECLCFVSSGTLKPSLNFAIR